MAPLLDRRSGPLQWTSARDDGDRSRPVQLGRAGQEQKETDQGGAREAIADDMRAASASQSTALSRRCTLAARVAQRLSQLPAMLALDLGRPAPVQSAQRPATRFRLPETRPAPRVQFHLPIAHQVGDIAHEVSFPTPRQSPSQRQ
jgi:hypothetical protein